MCLPARANAMCLILGALLAASGCRESKEGSLFDTGPGWDGPGPAGDQTVGPGEDAGKYASIKVAAVQYGPGLFSEVPGCSDDLCALVHLVTEAKQAGAQYAVTPEYALGGSPEPSPSVGDQPATDARWASATNIRTLSKLAASLGITLVFNLITGDAGKYYNTEIAVDGTGTVVARHYKYYFYSDEGLDAGTNCCDLFDTPAGKAGLLICSDINCIIYLKNNPPSCTDYALGMMNDFVARKPRLAFFSSYWMAKGSTTKGTAIQSKFAKYAKVYLIAANTISGDYHGGGVYAPDGTALQIFDSTKPGIAYGVIPGVGTPVPADSGVKPADSGVKPADSGAPSSAKVVVTELMPDPQAVADTQGEWLELYNAGTSAVNLSGWKLADSSGNSHTIAASLSLGVGQYLVLGNNSNQATNGGVPVAYSYGGWNLANSADQVLLYDTTGALADQVSYDSSWGVASGASLSLKNPALDNSLASSWCVEQAAWSGSTGDKGTPGAAAGCGP